MWEVRTSFTTSFNIFHGNRSKITSFYCAQRSVRRHTVAFVFASTFVEDCPLVCQRTCLCFLAPLISNCVGFHIFCQNVAGRRLTAVAHDTCACAHMIVCSFGVCVLGSGFCFRTLARRTLSDAGDLGHIVGYFWLVHNATHHKGYRRRKVFSLVYMFYWKLLML